MRSAAFVGTSEQMHQAVVRAQQITSVRPLKHGPVLSIHVEESVLRTDTSAMCKTSICEDLLELAEVMGGHLT